MDDKKMSKMKRDLMIVNLAKVITFLLLKGKAIYVFYLATNFDATLPLSSVQKWSIGRKKRIS